MLLLRLPPRRLQLTLKLPQMLPLRPPLTKPPLTQRLPPK